MKKREKNAKKPKPINFSGLESKILTPYQEAKTIWSWSDSKLTPQFIEKLCEHYMEWAQHPESMDIIGFPHLYGMSYRFFCELISRHDNLKQTHQLVKEILGMRKLKAARHKEYNCNPEVILKTIREYHPIFKDVHEENKKERADLKNQDKGATGPVTIVIPDQE